MQAIPLLDNKPFKEYIISNNLLEFDLNEQLQGYYNTILAILKQEEVQSLTSERVFSELLLDYQILFQKEYCYASFNAILVLDKYKIFSEKTESQKFIDYSKVLVPLYRVGHKAAYNKILTFFENELITKLYYVGKGKTFDIDYSEIMKSFYYEQKYIDEINKEHHKKQPNYFIDFLNFLLFQTMLLINNNNSFETADFEQVHLLRQDAVTRLGAIFEKVKDMVATSLSETNFRFMQTFQYYILVLECMKLKVRQVKPVLENQTFFTYLQHDCVQNVIIDKQLTVLLMFTRKFKKEFIHFRYFKCFFDLIDIYYNQRIINISTHVEKFFNQSFEAIVLSKKMLLFDQVSVFYLFVYDKKYQRLSNYKKYNKKAQGVFKEKLDYSTTNYKTYLRILLNSYETYFVDEGELLKRNDVFIQEEWSQKTTYQPQDNELINIKDIKNVLKEFFIHGIQIEFKKNKTKKNNNKKNDQIELKEHQMYFKDIEYLVLYLNTLLNQKSTKKILKDLVGFVTVFEKQELMLNLIEIFYLLDEYRKLYGKKFKDILIQLLEDMMQFLQTFSDTQFNEKQFKVYTIFQNFFLSHRNSQTESICFPEDVFTIDCLKHFYVDQQEIKVKQYSIQCAQCMKQVKLKKFKPYFQLSMEQQNITEKAKLDDKDQMNDLFRTFVNSLKYDIVLNQLSFIDKLFKHF